MSTGAWGENEAVEWLKKHGFEVLHTNWRSGRYELDIVASKSGIVHFVEVKTRQFRGLTTPEDAITDSKFRALQRAAEAYIEINAIDAELQFDAIAVEHDSGQMRKIRYIPNAMVPRW